MRRTRHKNDGNVIIFRKRAARGLRRAAVFVFALSLTLAGPPLPSVRAAGAAAAGDAQTETAREVVEIRTVGELRAFAQKCNIDAWSRDKEVHLKADLNLADETFEPIQVFNGVFAGEGHTIAGYSYTGSGYVVGFIRYIGETGKVQDLKLQADINSTDEKECVGGIAGVNYGEVGNCTFIGTVQGHNITGGIAGINEGTGEIRNCTVRGRVTGYYATGGVAGQNHGQIRFCENRAGINDNTEWVLEDDQIGLGLIESIDGTDTDVRVYSGVDTGGIAGYSDGAVALCSNRGRVGYEHTGYNIGGIVGRQTGTVDQCVNYGVVNGRKDIGGVVGQMEPYIELNEAESLRVEVDKLHRIVEKTINDMQAGSNALKTDADLLKRYADEALDIGKELTDRLSTFVDENLEETEKITGRLEHVVGMLPPVMDSADETLDHVRTLGETLRRVNDDLAVAEQLQAVTRDEDGKDAGRLTLTASVGGSLARGDGVQLEPKAGVEVTLFATPDTENGYRLAEDGVQVRDAQGRAVAVRRTADKDPDTSGVSTATNTARAYTFTMPQTGVVATAQFEPIPDGCEGAGAGEGEWVRLRSNPGGSCIVHMEERTKAGGEKTMAVTLTISPDASYTLAAAPVATDAGGGRLPVSKNRAGSYSYGFEVAAKPAAVELQFVKQTRQEAIRTATQDLRVSAEQMQQISAQMQDSLDKIRDSLKDATPSEQVWEKEVLPELLTLMGTLSDMGGISSTMLSSLSTLISVCGELMSGYGSVLAEAMKAAYGDLGVAVDNVQDAMNALGRSSDGLRAIVDYVNAQESVQFTKLGEEFNRNREDLHGQLKSISDCIGRLSDNTFSYSDEVMRDLRAVNDQVSRILNLLINRVEDYNESGLQSIYEDVSDEELDEIAGGRVSGCSNRGMVKGDINVGGVAGSMAIDEEDPEGSAAGTADYAVGNRYLTHCVIRGSVNEGFITAKKDGAGGIVGYMKIGVVTDCEGYGGAESVEGDYVGGICGQSLSIIRRSYALADVSGGRNVGGIAGYGDSITDCYSMARVEASVDRSGAIAGQTSSYEGREEKVAGNYFVGDHICGIDGISYVGVAEPLTYGELLEVEGLPLKFRHLKVTYRAGDNILGSEEVEYGASLAGLSFPAIPVKEGFYGVWPDVSGERMEGDRVLEAEYVENVTVVQSAGAEADASGKERAQERPYALVEHIFTEDARLEVFVDESMAPPPESEGECRIYVVAMENSGLESGDVTPLRLYSPWERARVWRYAQDGWELVESKVRGQYLQVELFGERGVYCVEETGPDLRRVWGVVGGGGAVVLLAAGYKRIRRKKGKKKKKGKKAGRREAKPEEKQANLE